MRSAAVAPTRTWSLGRAAVLCALLAAGGCGDVADVVRQGASDRPDAPALAARDFLRLVRKGRCEDAFARFSEQTRRDIALRSEAEIRNAPYYAEVFAPENLFCKPTMVNRFASYQPGTTQVAERRGDTAVVSVMLREGAGFLIPGFWPTSHRDVPVEMIMVREGARWRVALPGIYEAPPGGEPVEIGGALLQERPRRDPTDGRVSMSVTGPASTSAAALREAFMDFEALPRLLPGVVEARALEAPRAYHRQHVYVRVAGPKGVDVDFVVDLTHASGHAAPQADASSPGTAVPDSAAAAGRHPPFFRVSWHIPQPDTFPTTPGVTRIRTFGANLALEGGRRRPTIEYTFTVDTTEWPAPLRSTLTHAAVVGMLNDLLAGARRHSPSAGGGRP